VVSFAAFVLVGCGSGSAGSPAASNGPTKDISITYQNGQINPPPSKVQVALGTRVHLTVTSDVAEQVHNHYDDHEVDIPAGGTATFNFVANQPGVYEVELHHANKVLMQLQVG
jgi:plastocyanin